MQVEIKSIRKKKNTDRFRAVVSLCEGAPVTVEGEIGGPWVYDFSKEANPPPIQQWDCGPALSADIGNAVRAYNWARGG